MLVLGIESSCDECAAAVVMNRTEVLSSIVSSQIDLHARWGGIVPEIAARRHVETVIPVIDEAMSTASVSWGDLTGIAVTRGPGLIGSLLVGVSAAKTLSMVHQIPIIAVNHLEGHLCAACLAERPPVLPAVALIVSGGHTDLVLVEDWMRYRWLGGTLDDAAGETLDKVARCAGMGYPGGPVIDRLARNGNPSAAAFPRAWLSGGADFSFSGLKTAVVRSIRGETPLPLEDLAASVQAAIVDVLVKKTIDAAHRCGVGSVILSGGVAANSSLRSRMESEAARSGLQLTTPPLCYCTDNAAMIATAGTIHLERGEADDLAFDTLSSLTLGA